MRPIKMADLAGHYSRHKDEIDQAIQGVLDAGEFIQGQQVRDFEASLSRKLNNSNVISCANGTDALQIAMMALKFKAGDEVILPAFTYVATAEVIALLDLTPVFADVDERTFTVDPSSVAGLITKKTVAIVPVHLFGLNANMEAIMELANDHSLHVIEDAAQSLGSESIFSNGKRKSSGTIGSIGTTSFFPTKGLGAYGDGGALFTHDETLAEKIRMIANHGQRKKYHHELVGVNSRLDTLQAAILSAKLLHLEDDLERRRKVADFYDAHLSGVDGLRLPLRASYSTHVFHQYTVLVEQKQRDGLRTYLQGKGIPTMIYYPLPLHFQRAYERKDFSLPVSESLSARVLSLPIHTEMDEDQLSYICETIKSFR